MPVTVRDVARHASVSSGTVSRVLNDHANIDEELRRRVLRAMAELGYSRRPRGRIARSGALLREIGFFLSLPHRRQGGDLLGTFWAHILHGAEREARRYGVRITYRPIRNPAPQALRDEMAHTAPDAMLLVGATPRELVREALLAGLPTCLIDNVIPGLRADAILSDNFWGGVVATDCLLAHGHRDIAFIGGPLEPGPGRVNTIYTLESRAAGYRAALQRAGARVRDGLFESCDLTPSGGQRACGRLLASGERFTAIFCGNDPLALGVLRALREAGIDVPGQVSVVGFDDDLTDHAVPPLTTIRVNKEEMGAAAVRRLLDRSAEPHGPPMTVTLGVELVRRDSVGPPAGGAL